MPNSTADIRSIVMLGHGSCGKTVLTEAMLYKTGMVNRMGAINEGNTVADYDVEEKERNISIDLATTYSEKDGKRTYILDAPGYDDFAGNMVSGLSAADTALITVSAVNGIEVGTRKAWAFADERNVPRAFVINKVDGEHTNIGELLTELRSVFGNRVIPITVPDGEGESFSKVTSVMAEDGDEDYRTELQEAVVEVDEELMEKFLETMELSDEELANALPKAMAQGSVYPLFHTSATKCIGIEEMFDFINKYFPTLGDKPAFTAKDKKGEDVEFKPGGEGGMASQVFRIQTDPFVGKLAFFRVLRGEVEVEKTYYESSSESTFKLANLYRPQGKDKKAIKKALAGDICVVTRIESLSIASTICDSNDVVILPKPEYPTPMVSLAVEPKSRGDEQKISTAVLKAREEDPTFDSKRTQSTNELVIFGMGEMHLEIIRSRMKRRFDVEVSTRLPRIPYLETITSKAQSHYRHKKQTGGAGQFGEVYLKVEPNERGKGLEFVDEIVGGVIPRQFIPSVEKGILESLSQGILAGFPVVDVIVRLYDGKYHPVDSKEIAFKIAGRTAFQDAFMKARPMLMEPIYKISIYVPDRCLGDVTGDLTGRRGRIMGMDTFQDLQVINATVPLSEIQRYATELRSTTQGEGYYEAEFSHYDVVPSNIAEGVIARAKEAKEEAGK